MQQAIVVSLILSIAAGAQAAEPEHKSGKATLPADASEGPRDLHAVVEPFHTFIAQQPYGQTYKEIYTTAPPPKDQTGLGEAKTHPDLKKDPIEMQEQAQYLEETSTEVRYGFVSLRGMRAFRYGKLLAVQIVLERIGRDPAQQPKFKQDIEALAKAFKDPGTLLGLGPGFKFTRNDLVEQREKTPDKFPSPPLRIEIAPATGGTR